MNTQYFVYFKPRVT